MLSLPVPGDTAVPGRAGASRGGGLLRGSRGRRNACVLITLPASGADTWWLSNCVQELRTTVSFN